MTHTFGKYDKICCILRFVRENEYFKMHLPISNKQDKLQTFSHSNYKSLHAKPIMHKIRKKKLYAVEGLVLLYPIPD